MSTKLFNKNTHSRCYLPNKMAKKSCGISSKFIVISLYKVLSITYTHFKLTKIKLN